MKLRILSFAVLLSITPLTYSQINGLGDFFGSGQENAELLFKSYFSPWVNALGASLNGGWYNTAKPHQLGGFDLTITANTAIIPDIDKTFDISKLGLTNVNYPEGSLAATVAGKRDGGVPIVYTPEPTNFPNQNVTINTPNGSGIGFMVTPMAQLGIGLIKDTELNFRYMPRVNVGNYGNIGLWGIGVKHSIKQWIPVISKVPVFQLSVQGGFTKFNTNINLNVTPETYGLTGNGDYSDQNLGLEVKSFTASLLVGANLPVISFYGGVGFATTNANLSLNGNFPLPTVNSSGELTVTDVENPVDVDITNSDGSKVKPRLNAGMRIKMGILTLHGDYTYANYSVASVGIGISFR